MRLQHSAGLKTGLILPVESHSQSRFLSAVLFQNSYASISFSIAMPVLASELTFQY
jgi:hypothetical protein